eukprot:CAMPEP_0201476310 /NCGR_PEP_ID=MMETSP0151_2-20130828/1540_1 /ASSEMBLY_ACC=CAM_ASM_000257 /TAXON_ID=200890 /ORGANISM="Paramoeba atlantica, Strain 621/1 / CCAP 1560/9" /LENGTH=72 /DNA_ID=CAMNT_0047856641 /DNA_START=47 /DNA_END=265 /DNA_ORIENTATION=-
MEEVGKHKTKNSFYIVIRKKVYDITKFLDEHPGGPEILEDVAGKDATEEFDDIGHSNIAISMLDDFLVGELK